MAFLTKGFVVFAVMGVTVLPFLVWERRFKDLPGLAWLPALVVMIVSLPWAVAVYLREPDFWHYFVVVEHLHRFASQDAQHAEPVWYYIPILLGGMLPWLFVTPAAFSGLPGNGNRSIIRFCTCWLIFPFIFFSLSDGKLGTYILPILPAFVILLTLGMRAYLLKEHRTLLKGGLLILAAVSALAAIVFLFIPLESWGKGTEFSCSQLIVKHALAGAALCWSIITVAAALKKPIGYGGLLATAAGTALMLCSLHFSLSTMTHRRKMPVAFLESRKKEIAAADLVVSSSYLAPAAAWAVKRTDIDIMIRGGELQYGLDFDDAQNKLLDFETFTKLAEEHKNSTILIISDKTLRKYAPHLPQPASVETCCGICVVRF
jgi:4-amino-4-deoxy-L-arabinose transferase